MLTFDVCGFLRLGNTFTTESSKTKCTSSEFGVRNEEKALGSNFGGSKRPTSFVLCLKWQRRLDT